MHLNKKITYLKKSISKINNPKSDLKKGIITAKNNLHKNNSPVDMGTYLAPTV